MAVADGVGDGFDAGEASVGGVDDVAVVEDGAVGRVGDLSQGDGVTVGIEVVVPHVAPTPASPHSSAPHPPRDRWLVGVVGGEDSDGDGALFDVAVGVGDEVEQLAVGVGEGGVGVGRVGVAVVGVAGQDPVVGRFGHHRDGDRLVLGVGVVGEELRRGEADRGALIHVEIVGQRVGSSGRVGAGVDPHRDESGVGEAVAVADGVGDGFDAGEASVGGVDDVAVVEDGAVGRVGDLSQGDGVTVGIEVVVPHVDRHLRPASVRATSARATGGWLVSSAARIRMVMVPCSTWPSGSVTR